MEDVKIVAVQYKSILGNIRANVIKIKNIIKKQRTTNNPKVEGKIKALYKNCSGASQMAP